MYSKNSYHEIGNAVSKSVLMHRDPFDPDILKNDSEIK
jgi:hypothetical protein